MILNGNSGLKSVLPVRKGYFGFQKFPNLIKNSNLSLKISFKAENREFQEYFRVDGGTSGFIILKIVY